MFLFLCFSACIYATIHDITLSNDVRSAAVNLTCGCGFNVIKVGCILFFITTSIRTKI